MPEGIFFMLGARRVRSLLLGLVTVVSASASASARDDVSASVDALMTNACAMLATKTMTGVDIGDMNKSIALCNAHPRREECLNTQRMIAKYGKALPELTCDGTPVDAARPGAETLHPDAVSPAEKAIAENACAMAATAILTGSPVGNLRDTIAICNRNPNRQSCIDTKNFVASRRNGDAGGLTCE